MEEKSRRGFHFTPTQVGYIAAYIDPINITSDAQWDGGIEDNGPDMGGGGGGSNP
ncbi:hypothetical protein AGMMS50230_04770 [Spirochaetia bacterium]|nr:hypothetical protein AGMMS50230_04770 [Spirochaetia bacterium]